MSLAPPERLSPSKVSSFTTCALAFKFATIDSIREPGTIHTERGSLVHAALERLFLLPPAERTRDAAGRCLLDAMLVMESETDFKGLRLSAEAQGQFLTDAGALLDAYFTLEDPMTIDPIGIELGVGCDLDGLTLYGIIDQLRLTDGRMEVVDWKSGRAPSENYTQQRMVGVAFYGLAVEAMIGHLPTAVRLYHLGGTPTIITAHPTRQSVDALKRKLGAIWGAILKACERDDFRPKVSPLCSYCPHKPYCPAHGGDPATAPKGTPR